MSSGEILSAPEAVGAAAGEVPVATAAAAAVLAVRAASAAARADTRTVHASGADVDDAAAARPRADVPGPGWETVAAAVVELSARIRMLAERVVRAGVPVALPEPLSLTGLSAAEAAQWCTQTAQQLRSAQATVRSLLAEEESRRVMAQLPRAVATRPETPAALATFQKTLLERYSREEPSAPVPAASGLSVISTAVEAILSALDLDANEREHAYVVSAAAYVLRDDPLEARGYLRTLRAKAAGVNEAAARRRLGAQWLSALEETVVAAVEPPGPFLGTAARLRAVVAGDEDLTAELRARGAEAVEWAAEVTRHRFVCDVLSGCLSERDYTVEGAFDFQEALELRLTRADWHGEHSAEVWMDRHGAVHGRVVREKPVQGDRAAEDERTRCAAFNADIKTLGRRLHAHVVVEDGYVPQHRTAE